MAFRGIGVLRDRLLIQAGGDQLCGLTDTIERAGGGLLLTGDADLLRLPELRDRGLRGPVLIDRERYTGPNRVPAGEPFDVAWLEAQHILGVTAVLTDSGFVGAADLAGLRAILRGTGGLADSVGVAIALLPLHASWLGPERTAVLLEEINAAGVPVALIVAHARDPFDVPMRVRGLLTVLSGSRVPVMVLRCGVSAFGALAGGALAAALGISAGYRHLCPDGRAGSTAAGDRVFVPGLVGFHRLSRVVWLTELLATAGNAALHGWECRCGVCRLGSFPLPLASSEAKRAAHSVEAVLAMAEALRDGGDPGPARLAEWGRRCAAGLRGYADLETLAGPGGTKLPAPRALGAWQQVIADLSPIPS